MVGPEPERIADKEWRAFLSGKGVKPWYSLGGRFFLPGAFVHTDGDGEPDEQDRMWVKESMWLRAKQALTEGYDKCDTIMDAYHKGGFRGVRLWWALDLIQHEWKHLLVPRHDTPELDKAWLEKWCSHPGDAMPALRHAKEVGFRTNAFTRLLRWRSSLYRRVEFLAWFKEA